MAWKPCCYSLECVCSTRGPAVMQFDVQLGPKAVLMSFAVVLGQDQANTGDQARAGQLWAGV